MHQIKELKVEGFRRLHGVNIELRPLMVLVGANGVGKTSFLDAISLFSSSASGRLNPTLNQMGGLANLLSRNNLKQIGLSASMAVQGHNPLEYDLRLEPQGQGYCVSRETLTQIRHDPESPFKHIDSSYDNVRYYDVDGRALDKPNWSHNPLESSLSQVPKMFRQPEELRQVLGSVTQYHVLDVSARAPVKLPQQMKPATLPGSDGEDLVPFLYSLREGNRPCYEMIEDTLMAAFPGFEALNFPPVAAGMLSMTWKEKFFRSPLYPHQLSEGTLRFLWLAALLHSPGLSTITMIDEPEVSLHPELLSLLADLLRAASQRSHVIVATHSDRLIRFLNPAEVVVMDLDEEGFATARWADSLDLDKWLQDYSLDEIWRMGRMGGRS